MVSGDDRWAPLSRRPSFHTPSNGFRNTTSRPTGDLDYGGSCSKSLILSVSFTESTVIKTQTYGHYRTALDRLDTLQCPGPSCLGPEYMGGLATPFPR